MKHLPCSCKAMFEFTCTSLHLFLITPPSTPFPSFERTQLVCVVSVCATREFARSVTPRPTSLPASTVGMGVRGGSTHFFHPGKWILAFFLSARTAVIRARYLQSVVLCGVHHLACWRQNPHDTKLDSSLKGGWAGVGVRGGGTHHLLCLSSA